MKDNNVITLGNVTIEESGDTCTLENYFIKKEAFLEWAGDLKGTVTVFPGSHNSLGEADDGRLPLGENIRDAYLLLTGRKV